MIFYETYSETSQVARLRFERRQLKFVGDELQNKV